MGNYHSAGFIPTVSQGELDILLAAHERLLQGRPGGKRISFRFANLSGLDFAGRNLAEADFSGSSFEGAKLTNAILDRANLFGCDIARLGFARRQPETRRHAWC